jgi:deazaflavin-dependent oxidoreductase (nitroreductase family)
MNARMNRNIRRGRGKFLGMDVPILHTAGRRSEQPRQSPVAWFADGQDAWLIVASGGRLHSDWYLNLMAHPERASIELPGRDAAPVTPRRLDGADRAQAWQRITAAQPRYAKYQREPTGNSRWSDSPCGDGIQPSVTTTAPTGSSASTPATMAAGVVFQRTP